jgi:type IV pilus assembly protein PilM
LIPRQLQKQNQPHNPTRTASAEAVRFSLSSSKGRHAMKLGFGRKKLAYGLQILDNQVKLVGIMRTAQAIKVAYRHSTPLPSGCVRNGKMIDSEQVVYTIKQLMTDLKLQGTKAAITIPTASVIMRRVTMPKVKDRELRNLIDVELYGNSQLPFKNPSFDYVRLGSAKEDSTKDEVLVFITSQDVVEEYTSVIRRAGLEPIGVELGPLALYRLLVNGADPIEPDHEETLMLLQVEDKQADVCIFSAGIPVLMKTISLQTNEHAFTQDSNDAGKSLSVEIGRLLNYYKYSVSEAQQDVQRIICSGSVDWIDQVPALLEASFSGTVQKPSLASLIRGEEKSYQSFAVPIGIAMKGA